LLGDNATVHRRADGKPEIEGSHVSVAHSGELTLTASSDAAVGCDLEIVAPHSAEIWRAMLGSERFALAELIARREDLNIAATRVWTAMECLKKAGAAADAPLTLVDSQRDGWVTLRSGTRTLATCATAVGNSEAKLVLGVLASRPA
jgi:enediyne polyketide synthase